MLKSILILHGWGSSSVRWQKVKELLEVKGLKVFVPDLPGFGQEPPPTAAWDIDDYVEWVKSYIENLATNGKLAEPFFLLGHSFGGGIAIKYASKYPRDVEKLFLVAAAYLRRKTLKRLIFWVVSKVFRIFSFLPFYNLARRAFYKFIIRKSDYSYAKGIMKETYLKVIEEDLSNAASSIFSSTIIIWGEKDDVTPIKGAYLLNQNIKGSKLVIIPKTNHDLEQKVPEILVEKILENLK